MKKTSFNNYYNFFPLINSQRNNNLTSLNKKFYLPEQISTPNNSLLNNKIFFNDLSNYKRNQINKKINFIRNPEIRKAQFSSFIARKKRKKIFNDKNNDINNINQNYSSSLLNINKPLLERGKNKTFYLNKDNSSSNLSLFEKNNNNTSKNTLILDLNGTDSFKRKIIHLIYSNVY